MEKGLVLFLSTALFSQCQLQGIPAVQVLIDGYTNSSILTAGSSLPLGRQFILVCWIVGLPYGTPLSYTWTCPNGPCEVEGYYGRKVYSEHILAVNTTSTSDGGKYTCQVTATGGQEATGSFTLNVTGGIVVHSYGRLIPHEFPITDLQQISGPDGNGRITCTVSSGTARFIRGVFWGLTQTGRGRTASLVVNLANAVRNRDVECKNKGNYFYLFLSSDSPLRPPILTDITAEREPLEYQVVKTTRTIAGYEVTRFGVPMIGQYVNTGRGVTISPVVPGVQYRIIAWTIGSTNDGHRRSATPVTRSTTTREKIPSAPRQVFITRILEAEIELNWLPPTEPNGEVHYVIYYTPEGSTEQSIDTRSNQTHYNLTGLERNRVYTNITVQANNSAGRSGRSAVIALPVPSPPRSVNINRVYQDGVELNWLPPTEPNGEVHYVIYYTPENGKEQSIDTGSNLTHYNLTGLERNRVYTNIAVQAVNSVGRSERNAVMVHYNHTPPAIATNTTNATVPMPQSNQADNTLFIVVGVVASVIALLVLLAVVVLVVIVVRRMKSRKEVEPVNYYEEHTPHVGEHAGGATLYQNSYEKPEIQHHTSANISGDYEVDDTFTSAASARAPLGINTLDGVQYSKIDQGPTGHQDRGGYGVEGMYEQPERNSVALAVMGVQRAQKETAGSAQSQSVSKAENLNELYAQPDKSKKTQKKAGDMDEELNTTPGPDQLYAQPDKTKKGGKKQSEQKQPRPVTDPEQLYTQPNKARAATGKHPVGEDAEAEPNITKKTKKDSQVTRSEEAADPSDDMYAKPDMTKKGDRKSQLPPQAPLPYKKHKEAKHKSEGDGDTAPDLPPPYIPDEERYYNTRGGAGPPNQEGNYDYATVDWHPQ